MSQLSGVAGDGFAASTPKAGSSGRAVLLLALAVILGTVLLHELDGAPKLITQASTEQATPAETPAAAPAAAPVTPQVRTPSEVKVLVANGTTINGAANKVAGRLQPIGYQLVKPGNTSTPSNSSVVQFAAGYQAEAQALATSLGIASTAVQPMANPAPIADLQGANVVVIVGTELAGQQATATNGATANAQTGAAAGQNANAALNGPLNNNTATNGQATTGQSTTGQATTGQAQQTTR